MGTELQVTQSSRCSILSTLRACLWCLLCHHLLSIQLLLLLRVTILTLDRPVWEVTVLTRTPTATWLRRLSLRTSASPTQRGHAIPRTRRRVTPSLSEIAVVLSKLMSRESVST